MSYDHSLRKILIEKIKILENNIPKTNIFNAKELKNKIVSFKVKQSRFKN